MFYLGFYSCFYKAVQEFEEEEVVISILPTHPTSHAIYRHQRLQHPQATLKKLPTAAVSLSTLGALFRVQRPQRPCCMRAEQLVT